MSKAKMTYHVKVFMFIFLYSNSIISEDRRPDGCYEACKCNVFLHAFSKNRNRNFEK